MLPHSDLSLLLLELRVVRNGALLFAAMSFLVGPIALVSPAAGQQSDFWRDFSDWEARRKALNSVAEAHERSLPYRRPAAAPRVRDIKRIQALNSELTQGVSQGSVLDFRFLAKSASEIKKRGKRLQLELAFPKPKEGDRRSLGARPEDLRALVTVLGASISSFAGNPVFKKARVVDANILIKAGRDLEEIIELSEWVERSCKEMARSTAVH
ncbi:MAG TPA: hypothetical protein VEM96_10620 [Pyrinomonadaceae bacterium]|nr:hypothetical protein [Pyrinomonadaceae bacterium]